MTKRTPAAVGTSKSSLLGSAAPAAPAVPSEEKTPEEKAVIAAVAQAPVGAAEPFGVTTSTDVAKNIVAADLVAEAAAAGDPLAPAPLASAPASGTAAFDGAERAIGAPDVADQLGGPIPRGPAVAAVAEAIDTVDDRPLALGDAPRAGPMVRPAFSGHAALAALADEGRFDPIGDLAGRTFMVRSASDRGRRRGGLGFTPVAVAVDVDDLTPENLGAILSDPQLFAELLPRED